MNLRVRTFHERSLAEDVPAMTVGSVLDRSTTPCHVEGQGREFMELRERLLSIAARLMWWLEPEDALAQRTRFLGQVMALGTWEDVQVARRAFGWDAFRAALEQAGAGVFDPRSWAYWHAFFGRQELELPKRPIS